MEDELDLESVEYDLDETTEEDNELEEATTSFASKFQSQL